MKLVYSIVFIIFLSSFIANNAEDPKRIVYQAFFACNYNQGFLPADEFVKLTHQSLCAKDSANNVFRVTGFEMTYAERGLFQDSSGLPIIHTDYSLVVCKGDSIPGVWKKEFMERAYTGDTIYFDKIQVQTDSKQPYYCKGIKLVLK